MIAWQLIGHFVVLTRLDIEPGMTCVPRSGPNEAVIVDIKGNDATGL